MWDRSHLTDGAGALLTGYAGEAETCATHGGGRRCGHDGCAKFAQGATGLCIKHGGGKRCVVAGCAKVSRGNTGVCVQHGGNRR